jgi:hypothetical protein
MEDFFKKAYLIIILISFIFCFQINIINSQQTESQPLSVTPISTPLQTSATSTPRKVIKIVESGESGGASVIFAPPQTSTQEIEYSIGSTMKGGISNVIIIPNASGAILPDVLSAVISLEIKPTEIFTQVLSEATNITVNTTLQNNKVIYFLEAPQGTSTIIKNPEEATAEPIFDISIDAPVEFKLKNNEMLINNEQSVNYGGIKSALSGGASFPLVVIPVQSTAVSPIYNLEVKPESNGATMKFIASNKKEITSTIQSDFKIENKQLYVVENDQQQVLKVLPPEIYSAIENTGGKITSTINLSIENNEPVYNLKVNEPFKLFWVKSMRVDVDYKIGGEGKILKAKRPWYTILGDVASPQLVKY